MKNRNPRSPLLQRLLHNMRTAMQASKDQLPIDEATEYYAEERRKFLLNSGKLVAGTALLSSMPGCSKMIEDMAPNSGSLSEANANGTAPRIAIIGAGIAGLHAAFLLKQKGYIATVYEGSNRTGGRMFTARNTMGPGLYTEIGGEFIDSIHKDMLTLAKTFGLSLLDTKPSNQSSLQYQAYYFNGVHYTEQQVVDAFAPYAQLIKSDQLGMSSVITADSHSGFDAMLDNMSLAQYFDRIGLNGWLRELLDVAYVTEYGQSIDQQTALNFLWLISPKVANGSFEIFGASDERYKIAGGNQQITDKLADQVKNQIKLSQELSAIKQNSNGSYQLTFASGSPVRTAVADYILITIPFTLLRNVDVQPAWPDWKRRAIFDIGYGNNSKLMMGFTKRYWNDIGFAGYYFADTFLQSGWDNSELQNTTTGGLTIFSGGQQALDVGTGSIAMQVNNHLPVLDRMYPGATRFYNGKADRFIWPTYKWTKSSYTCFKPGQYTTIAGNEIKPIGKIYFAGEHCSYDFQGYMNGGAETGRRAAEAMIASIKSPQTSGVTAAALTAVE